MCNRFIRSIDKLDQLEEHSYIFLLTVIKRMNVHLHLDRTLGILMNNRGVLTQCFNDITKKIGRMKVSHISRNYRNVPFGILEK